MEKKEFEYEQAYLERVEKYINKRIRILECKKEELRRNISAGRKEMWENGRHGVNDFDDVVDIYLHSEGIGADEKRYMETMKELQRLEMMKNSPYFARIDVREDGCQEAEVMYIGAVGLKDDKTYAMYVCDWRAPVSSLFYGFDVGKARYEVDNHRIDVELTRKRQIQITKGELENIYDTNSSMHDAILGGILSENTGNKLKVIVSSIQKEQNNAIRKTDKPVVLIYGPAGSGKTSVGLHRLAYILYHQREKLHAEDIVILSNNNIYHSYVSGILPALCEDEVSHTIFQDLLRKFLPRDMYIEDYYAQYRALRGTEEGNLRKQWLCIKYSVGMLQYMKNYFSNYRFEVDSLIYRSHVIITAEELQRKIKRVRYESFCSSLEGVQNTIKKLYEDYFEEHKKEICEEIEERVKEYISVQEVEILFLKAKRQAVQAALDKLYQKNLLTAEGQLIRIMEGYAEDNIQDKQLSRSMVERLRSDMERKRLWYEDALLYLLVCTYMGKIKPFRNVLHVLVDEAQDYHMLQFEILKQLYPKSSFTLLADVCQAISPLTTMYAYEDFEVVFGSELEQLPLLKSYRSSGPINALAFSLMDIFRKEYANKYSYFQRDGKIPEYMIAKDMERVILRKISEWNSYNLIGIIMEEELPAESLYQKLLNNAESVQRITKSYEEMNARILIMPLILTKGLEFDAVLVCGRINAGREGVDLKGLAGEMYLAGTRALHELAFVEEEELPDSLKDCEAYLNIVRI